MCVCVKKETLSSVNTGADGDALLLQTVSRGGVPETEKPRSS